MASTSKESRRKVVEGVFAINKPQWASSAGILRDLQTAFHASALFTPWLTSTKRSMQLSGARRRAIEHLKVKLGHGGTLDPMATGVLIVGVGKGTKCLQRFLECTKSYECVVLFGAATDSYDAVGKVVGRAAYAHVTRELVEEKLARFRGKIMQKPSVFSALKVDGKKMYEYAREGGEIPEVAARPVEVLELEMVEWLAPGTHEYKWPEEEVGGEERVGAEKLMGIREKDAAKGRGRKRSRSRSKSAEVEVEVEDHITGSEAHPKRPRTDTEPAMSGALPVENAAPREPSAEATPAEQNAEPANPESTPVETAEQLPDEPSKTEDQTQSNTTSTTPPPQPPAARLRMTVTSGFYVRSLCHDLGLACDSLGLMSSLIRTRQGDYELGKNVLEYSDLEAGPEVWEPQVEGYLKEFMEKEGWESEEVEDEESWLANRKERENGKREADRDRSFQGAGEKKGNGNWNKGKGNWKGRKGKTFYSKDMKGGRQD
ncbi:tRNA pseudouridine synthase B [Westerdykella ornata]|uniref:tRNA pseudouridine(55) synthase n=1 Tax=Westerdykella ornata TaxID=318751 RepID=A0A6A6J8J6_WESOR|nr:tRNA pseudouridine synthase B [Westerdykella ornata]KAF2272695.1 tRNA pseudouridine synthase B [Westerdykella ornata]